ncbi:hypothetical protein FKM82_027111 [Ascaphus truei]
METLGWEHFFRVPAKDLFYSSLTLPSVPHLCRCAKVRHITFRTVEWSGIHIDTGEYKTMVTTWFSRLGQTWFGCFIFLREVIAKPPTKEVHLLEAHSRTVTYRGMLGRFIRWMPEKPFHVSCFASAAWTFN